ncbi:hypothetical protein BKA62DRAFT_709780 [Auriculariales sp. MPI-PUGE-AT-0066]|nr:hypothetical protein BKA62DRAFT_709780 [Auriculariales sp. MPI-PUGE-AT-0066]
MRFTSISILALAASMSSLVSPVAAHEFQCNGQWNDGGLTRLSFLFKGFCDYDWGKCFLHEMRNGWTVVHNWQCWQRDDGWWQADFTVAKGATVSSAAAQIENKAREWDVVETDGCWKE